MPTIDELVIRIKADLNEFVTGLEQAKSEISSFGASVKSGIGDSFESAKVQVNAALAGLPDNLNAVSQAITKNEIEAKKLEIAFKDSGKSSSELEAALKPLKTETELLKLKQAELTQKLSEQKITFDEIASKGKVVAGAFAAIGGTVLYTTDKFMEFNVALDEIKTILGATGEQLAQVKASAMQLSDGVFSAKQLADAYKILATNGIDVNDSLKAMPGIVNLAKAAHTDLGIVTDRVTDLMSAYKLSVDDVTRASDVMIGIATHTGKSFDSIASSLINIGPLITSAGMSFYDAAGFIQAFTSEGMSAGDAAQALAFSIRNLSDPTKEIGDAFYKLGIPLYDNQSALDGFNGSIQTHKAALDELKGKLGEVEAAYNSTQEAMNGLQGQMDELGLQISKKELELKKAEKALRDLGRAPEEITGATALLRNEIENLRLKTDEMRIKQQEFRIEANKQKDVMDDAAKGVKLHGDAIDQLTKDMEAAKGKTLPFKDLMVELAAKFQAMPDGPEKAGLAVQLFGRQSGEMLKFLDQGPDAIRNMSAAQLESVGITSQLAGAVDKNISPMQKLKDTWNDLTIQIGGSLAPFADGAAAISGIGMAIGGTMMGLPTLAKGFEMLKGLSLVGMVASVTGAITTITTAISAAGAFLLANPIFLAITAIVLAIIALKYAWDHNLGGIQDKVHTAVAWISEKFEALKNIVSGASSWLKNKLDMIPTPLLLLLGPIGAVLAAFKHFEDIKNILGGAWDAITSGNISGALDSVKSSILSSYESLKTGIFQKFSDIVGGVRQFAADHKRELNIIGGAFLTVATGGFWPLWKNNVGGIRDATTEAWETIKTKTSELAEWLAAKWEEIKTAAGETWEALKNAVSEKWEAIKTTVSDAITAIVNFFTPYYEQLKIIGSTLFTRLKEGLELAYNAFVKPYIDTVTGAITSALDFGTRAYNWGKNLLSSFIDGIKSMFSGLGSALSDFASRVANYIAIESPAKEGPLSRLMEWGPNLVTTFTDGIKSNIGKVNDAFELLKPEPIEGKVFVAIEAEPVPKISIPDKIRATIEPILGALPKLPELTANAIIKPIMSALPEMPDITKELKIMPVLDKLPDIPSLEGIVNYVTSKLPQLPKPPDIFGTIQYILGRLPELPKITKEALISPVLDRLPKLPDPKSLATIIPTLGKIPELPTITKEAIFKPVISKIPEVQDIKARVEVIREELDAFLDEAIEKIISVRFDIPELPEISLKPVIALIKPMLDKLPTLPELPKLENLKANIVFGLGKFPELPKLGDIVANINYTMNLPKIIVPNLSTLLFLKPVMPDIPAMSLAARIETAEKAGAKQEVHYHTWDIRIENIENKADADYLLNEIQRKIVKKTAAGIL